MRRKEEALLQNSPEKIKRRLDALEVSIPVASSYREGFRSSSRARYRHGRTEGIHPSDSLAIKR
jgi:hypothetical protein